MQTYAIIQLAGKQFKVSEGETFVVDQLEAEADKNIEISDVLLVGQDSGALIGEPLVAGAVVTLKVVDHHRGDKIRVAKFKSKSRYRRVQGHRQYQTTLEVVKIAV